MTLVMAGGKEEGQIPESQHAPGTSQRLRVQRECKACFKNIFYF